MLENIISPIFKVKVLVKTKGQKVKMTKISFLRPKATIILTILKPEASNYLENILMHIFKVKVVSKSKVRRLSVTGGTINHLLYA